MTVNDRSLLLGAFIVAAALSLVAQPVEAVVFGPNTPLQGGVGQATAVAFGLEDPDPANTSDGCVYAVDGNGLVRRICFNAAKTVTSNDIVVDLNGARMIGMSI